MIPPQAIKVVILFALFSMGCNAESNLKTKTMFNQIEEKYKEGYCDSIMSNPVFNSDVNRYVTLLVMQDITMFATGSKTITGRWIENIETFRIGRKMNQNFIDFIAYADRKDIKSIVRKDSIEFSKAAKDEVELKKNSFSKLIQEVEGIEKSSLMPMATRTKEEAQNEAEKLSEHPVICRIYQIAMDESSQPAIEFQNYTDSVRKRAAHKNIEKLEQSLKDLEAYN